MLTVQSALRPQRLTLAAVAVASLATIKTKLGIELLQNADLKRGGTIAAHVPAYMNDSLLRNDTPHSNTTRQHMLHAREHETKHRAGRHT